MTLRERERVAVRLGGAERVAVADAVRVIVGAAVRVEVGVAARVRLSEALAARSLEAEREVVDAAVRIAALAVLVALLEGAIVATEDVVGAVPVALPVGTAVDVPVGALVVPTLMEEVATALVALAPLAEAEGAALVLCVTEALPEPEAVAEGESEPDLERDGGLLLVAEEVVAAVRVWEELGELVPLEEPKEVQVAEMGGLRVALKEPEELTLTEEVEGGVREALRRVAMLRPW